MEWFIAVVVIAILGVAAMAAAGGMGEMAEEPVRDTFRQDLPADRMLDATDISALRFGVTLRGYAMNQVDDLLDRLTREIAERDATIAELAGLPLGERPSRGGDEPRQQGAGTGEESGLGSPADSDAAPAGERA
jgi:DivIVA domain-containing protein